MQNKAGDGPAAAVRSTHLLTVPVADIAESPGNTRLFEPHDTDETMTLEELAASIAALGLQQYPKVRAQEGPVPWVLVYGARRLRACRDILKWREIPVIVDEGLSRESAAEIAVVENLQRRDLHPMDEARGLAILRGQGKSTREIATRLGRRADWVKERLKLCDLPAPVQDIFRHSVRMTLQQALSLHEYMRGGPENTGFPDLVTVLAEGIESGQLGAKGGAPSIWGLWGVARDRPHLVQTINHRYDGGDGWWGGTYFDSRRICTKCPFGAYRPHYHDGVGYCLLPSHYGELKAKGEAKYKATQAEATSQASERGGPDMARLQSWQSEPVKTPAQKGRETKERHRKQRAAYGPTVAAIERTIDMIPAVDGVDVAVLCAYTLTTQHVERAAIEQVVKRHGLESFTEVEPTPTATQIERLRQIEPVQLVRYTLEALLLTQARRARDYDPGRERPEPVLALYLQGHVDAAIDHAA